MTLRGEGGPFALKMYLLYDFLQREKNCGIMKYSARSRSLFYDKKHFVSSFKCGGAIFKRKLTIISIFSLSFFSFLLLLFLFFYFFFLFEAFINGFPRLMFNLFLKFIRCSILPVPSFHSFHGASPFLSDRRRLLHPYTFAFSVS